MDLELSLSCEERVVKEKSKTSAFEKRGLLLKTYGKKLPVLDNFDWQDVKSEVKLFLTLAIPMMVSFFFEVNIYPATVIFGGHLGTKELASIGLANSVLMVIVAGASFGSAQACDTFFSQICGKGNIPYLIVVAQRAFVIFGVVAIVLISLVINFGQLFSMTGQDPTISALAGDYLLICAPVIPLVIWIKLLRNLCFVQKNRNIVVFFMAVNQIVNALFHWLFCYNTPLTMFGSALAQNIGMIVTFIGLLIFNFKSRVGQQWTGLKSSLFQDWGAFAWVAVCGMSLVAMDGFPMQFTVFLAGSYGEVVLSAQVIGINFVEMAYTVMMGFGSASAIMIGGYLGAGDPQKAKRATMIATVIAIIAVSVEALCLIIFRYTLPKIFTNDQNVINECASLLPYMALFALSTGINTTIRGIFRGVAKLGICSAILFCNQYVLAVPIIILLNSTTNLGLKAVWLGFSIGALTGCVVYALYMKYKFDWDKMAEEAQALASGSQQSTAPSSPTKTDPEQGEGTFLLEESALPSTVPRSVLRKRLLTIIAVAVLLLAAFINRLTYISEEESHLFNSTTSEYFDF